MKKSVLFRALLLLLCLGLCGCNGAITAEHIPQESNIAPQETMIITPMARYVQTLEAVAQYPSSNEEWEYIVYDCYVELTKYLGRKDTTHLIIPEEIDGLPVWVLNTRPSIGYQYTTDGHLATTPDGNAILKKDITVDFPDSLLIIGDYAFSEQHFAAFPDLPEELYIIGNHAFLACTFGTSDVTLPPYLGLIGTKAFDDVSLPGSGAKSLTIPSSMEEIGPGALGDGIWQDVYILSERAILGKDFIEDAAIHGYAGSSATQYCIENDMPFVLIENEEAMLDAKRRELLEGHTT